MKKILVLILALVICSSFVACGGGEEQADNNSQNLVGSWIYNNGESVIIVNADNTGKVLVNGSISEITWQYNASTKMLMMKTPDFTEEATYMDDGTLYVDGWSYSRTDDCIDINSYASDTTNGGKTMDYKELSTAELEEYYDTDKFVGTPRVEEGFVATLHSGGTSVTKVDVYMIDHNSAIEVNVPEGYSEIVYCIVVDNNTPNDISDDKIAHHWLKVDN